MNKLIINKKDNIFKIILVFIIVVLFMILYTLSGCDYNPYIYDPCHNNCWCEYHHTYHPDFWNCCKMKWCEFHYCYDYCQWQNTHIH